MTPVDENRSPRKSRSLISSFRIFTRRKNFQKKTSQHYENGFTSTPSDMVLHSSSAGNTRFICFWKDLFDLFRTRAIP